MAGPPVPAQQLEAPPQAGEHAEAQHIDLEDAEGTDVVLVPLEDGPALHGGVGDDSQLDQRPAGDDEAADMGRGVAGEVEDLLSQLERCGEAKVIEIEPLHLGQCREAELMPRA